VKKTSRLAAPLAGRDRDGRLPFRIGHGYDLHRLRRGGRLMMAGIVVSEQCSAVAHSDGDVVIHAVVDAMLGALGLGDIGEHFPNNDPQWKDAASRLFLDKTWADVLRGGYRLGNLDITILAERPKLQPFKPKMIESLRIMLDNPQAKINIKAATNERCDAIGHGRAVAAHAVVLLIST
jgi:2-C-methyl-D-erythritol 2,4-cyclodiphosphate synthase